MTSTLATHACIADLLTEQTPVTGYSVGKMAAWSIAGVWTADEALRLTDVRAGLMQDAAGPDGRFGYVRGLDLSTVERLLERYHCEVAIRNPDGLVVIGGAEQDVTNLCDEAAREGARTGLLAVRIASHTTRLAPACKPLQRALAASRLGTVVSQRLLLAGGDGERIFSVAAATTKLAKQVARPVDWSATLEALAELGVTEVLDLGPGHALAEMMQAFRPSMPCYSADGFHSIDGLRKWIASK
ncbi:acyltransferase domain-containing protein [Bradyrhizobium sp. DOA9]|uniref:acyltransferase domain-containing protein n=1 Tax=Bradyrhizobium sp. DOA9 TaxID=1126627 RepID=UPI0004998A15|nr:acyltransferase domain-containing protein [Bradyrhizobium sp. DOA9]GAJ37994.1 malonyl CoA-acyl carrier protein transacylase [Bradyrhizobium sp. DOA9]